MRTKSIIQRLLVEMTGAYKVRLVFVFLFIVISAAAGVAGSLFVRMLVDDYIAPLMLTDNPEYGGLIKALFILGFIYIAGVASTFLYNRMMISVSQGMQKRIRDKLFAHMQTLPVRYFDTHTHGDMMSRFTNDTDTLREFFSMSLPQMLSSVFTILSVTAAMLSMSIPLSGVVFVFVMITLFVSKMLSGSAVKRFLAQQEAVGELNGHIKEMLHGQKVIKVFCHERAALEAFEERNERLRRISNPANQLTNIIMPIVMNIAAVQYVATAFIGGYFAIHGLGGVTLGVIAAFLTLSRSLSGPIGSISMQVNAVTMALAGARRIFTVMDEPPEIDDGYVTMIEAEQKDGEWHEADTKNAEWVWKHPHGDGTVTYTPVKGDVCLLGVDFGYIPEKLVLHNITLTAEPGQKLAFVGATGAGKTTITNLINRFYDIADGKLRYDGININKIKKDDLRRSLGIVLQDTCLFTGTVADNIRYGKPGASMWEVVRAAQIANADEFISRLPNGYDTILTGGGGDLSSGQKQLLSIARAAIANPPVMILDEATSSIDTRTEAIVEQGMNGLMKGRTVFVIAHRLSTIVNADAIMVIDGGKIIESGTHEELLQKQGVYYRLHKGIRN